MKRFVFAVAAVALVASAGSSQETPPVTAAPVVVGSAGPVVEATPATSAPARRGLFGRLRGRNATTTTTMPATVAPAVLTPGTTIAPTPTTVPSTPVPMPMPMPMPGTKTPSTMTVPTAPNGVVVASGTVMSGTGDVLMPAMATATATTTAMPARRGLFGRLRNR